MKKGLLLLNLGTPKAATKTAVFHFLREFLADPRVIDLPLIPRYLLLYGFILPFKIASSTKNYQAIWRKEGSPFLYYSLQLIEKLQHSLAGEYQVALGLRYGELYSIEKALETLKDCDSLTILPLYPQFASSSSGSAIEATLKILATRPVQPFITLLRDFYQHPAYIKAEADWIKPYLDSKSHLLFSYHGVPERHIKAAGCATICPDDCPKVPDHACYKAQCYATSRTLADALALSSTQYSVAFQSRLGKTPWIKPYTDESLIHLAQKGVQHLLICSPSFVVDCIETLEEIGIRAKEQWQALGGKTLTLIPSLNAENAWIEALANIAKSPTCAIGEG